VRRFQAAFYLQITICNCQRTVSSTFAKGFGGENGGGERDRTDDPLRARQVLSQLSYTPNFLGTDECGGPRWTRTTDLTIISRVL
jgi:hypothetical protein